MFWLLVIIAAELAYLILEVTSRQTHIYTELRRLSLLVSKASGQTVRFEDDPD